ncbi:potassium channel family protein [Qingshengfaniella alkalisoli]|uniref:TrkA family potassium uptake protein n=1 Tax=Qingshengfaniella alkalisoli TaxID=2599296 RepID=A0A5B8IQ31_9RHOB|nr:TrkA family potassium uptake protein [Qingshengfaniella alkalisoli]QDY68362.1 TrkA family potassium uptake protein [Qingshengfaniella alkalisoli]
MARKTRNFAVIGLGTFGTTVAKELTRFGNYVIGVDINERNVAAMADTLTHAVIADARDDTALREAGIGECDVVLIAIGEDLEANVLATINAKMIGVPLIWAKAVSRTHHRILNKLGADRVVQPEEEVGMHIAQMLHNPLMRDYVSLGNGFHVVNMRVPESLEGKRVSQLDLGDRFELRCLGVMRGSEFIGSDSSDCALSVDDKLLVLGNRINLREFAASL